MYYKKCPYKYNNLIEYYDEDRNRHWHFPNSSHVASTPANFYPIGNIPP